MPAARSQTVREKSHILMGSEKRGEKKGGAGRRKQQMKSMGNTLAIMEPRSVVGGALCYF